MTKQIKTSLWADSDLKGVIGPGRFKKEQAESGAAETGMILFLRAFSSPQPRLERLFTG